MHQAHVSNYLVADAVSSPYVLILFEVLVRLLRRPVSISAAFAIGCGAVHVAKETRNLVENHTVDKVAL